MVKTHNCTYVEASDLVPKTWRPWFWTCISTNAPFSWGGNNRSLVTASDFAQHCDTALELHGDAVTPSTRTRFLNKLRELGETYVDLEN